MLNKNKIQAALFDFDGVLVKLPHYYSYELEKQGYKNAEKYLSQFFNSNAHDQCLEDKKDILQEIKPYLDQIGWEKSAQDFLNEQYNFESKFIDWQMLQLVKKLQTQGIEVCLCTDQDKNRAKYLQTLAVWQIFSRHFMAYALGYRKCQRGFWVKVVAELKMANPNFNPRQVLFVDDHEENIKAAEEFGLQTCQFTNLARLRDVLNKLIRFYG